ncbi:MAG: prepilin-type N-terminal cleavage/methylation domain-containing protein [Fimbriimonadaceae bacterium]|jgi:prepilin-type N-terminal cleavage/methylation domain-containing protein|nr:prepilin-type N-terminal cleavage/methylation domain-containing protein [Fimbriimonadaceae bacterium]
MKTRAFTLIELLVVIAIIAILAAILFPVFAQAKVAAKKSVAISNQKQLGTSMMLYMGDHDDYLPNLTWADSFGAVGTADGRGGFYSIPTPNLQFASGWNGGLGWPLAIIPYHKNSTAGGNTNSIYVHPQDSARPNFSKPEFKVMLDAVNWPNSANFNQSDTNNARIFPLSYCANIFGSYTTGANASGVWGSTAYTGPRNQTSVASPSNTMLITEYGAGDAWGNGITYSNYYCHFGYGSERWPNGNRFGNGRTMSFMDGHSKFVPEPIDTRRLLRELGSGGGEYQRRVREAYASRRLFDMPDRDQ